jgi:site-specific recombinase XerD
VTIKEALDGWYLHLRAEGASVRTLDRYDRVWRQFGAWLAERAITELDQLRPEHARLYVLARMAQVSLITAHYEVTRSRASRRGSSEWSS